MFSSNVPLSMNVSFMAQSRGELVCSFGLDIVVESLCERFESGEFNVWHTTLENLWKAKGGCVDHLYTRGETQKHQSQFA